MKTEQISCLINSLTNDEDIRQDLWVYYLHGKSIESFESKLEEIKLEYSDHIELQKSIWQLLKQPLPEELSSTIKETFTEYEHSIIACLMLGLEVKDISTLKGISEVRIRQSIATIRYNKIWEVIYGIKEKSNRRRKIRS